MSINFSALCYSLRKQSLASGVGIKLGHCQQLLSAAFGYKSFAALQAAQAVYAEADVLDEVDSVVLNSQMLVSRAGELGIPLDSAKLVSYVTAAFQSCLPRVSVYADEDSWAESIRTFIVDLVETDENVIGLIADTNNDGVRETYVPFHLSTETLPAPEQTFSTNMKVRITLDIDTDRPYAGHKIDVSVDLRIDRIGRGLWSALRGHVTFWKMANDEPRLISRAQALADEFGLTLEEAEELVDVEEHEIEGNDGAVYGHYFDFEDYASPAVATKLMARFGRLNNLRVGLNFFDQVVRSFD